MAVLDRIRRRWILRRAVVRHAEYVCYSRGDTFRGRFYPIYAKDIKQRLTSKRVAGDEPPLVRVSRLDRLSGFGGRRSGFGTPARSPMPRLFALRRAHTVAPSTASPENSMANGGATPKRTPKGERSKVVCSANAKMATANFGLQMREEQLRATMRADDMAQREMQMDRLIETVGGLQRDVHTVLRLLGAPIPGQLAPELRTPKQAPMGSMAGTPSSGRGSGSGGPTLPPLAEELGGRPSAANTSSDSNASVS